MSDASSEPAPQDVVGSGLEFVVGIGASAGGLESLQSFFSGLPADLPVAYLVAQHLAPEHPSLIVELLARVTGLRVVTAQDQLVLTAGLVVVCPPNHDLVISRGQVLVTPPHPRPGASPSVDALFTSLSEHWGRRSIGIVLSGTGSDGAHGLRAIRSSGGLAFVQDPATARFDGMPKAAITLAGADAVAPADMLASLLVTAVGHLRSEGRSEAAPLQPAVRATITALLAQRTGVDFSGYKESTVLRQMHRRMALRHVPTIEAYVLLLAQDADEAQTLASSLLVSVTEFFRDPSVFTALQEVLSRYTADMDPMEPLRMWVPGCATGEEVYSLAMIAAAALGDPPDLVHRVKIFGTDLDDAALAVARRATYPHSALEHIPEPLAQRYTERRGETIQVVDRLRQCVVFARHNFIAEPPFPRLDLISCRNTLIYFTSPLRDQALAVFRFALKPGGHLVLGQAESLGDAVSHFAMVDAENRIYRRTTRPAPHMSLPSDFGVTSSPRAVAPPQPTSDQAPAGLTHQVHLLDSLLNLLTIPHLVLDADGDVVRLHGDVSPYCRLPVGPMSNDVLHLLHHDVADEARTLLTLARVDDSAVRGGNISVAGGAVTLSARRLHVDSETYFVLSFEEAARNTGETSSAGERSANFDEHLRRLEEELTASRDSLRVSLAELQAAHEELEAYSEELQASNEELQASNEELVATNDELIVLNREREHKTEDLQRLNSELETIQSSLSQGMIIVDLATRVTRYSPLAVRLFALIHTDIGRPLVEVPTTMPIPGLTRSLSEVIGGAPRRNLHVSSDNVAYLVQVLPHTSTDGKPLGAIVTLTDVTEMEALRTAAESALVELQDRSQILVDQASVDSTTGLHSRGFFTDTLELQLSLASRGGTRLALMWLDVDHFKAVNDEHGHQAGDLTLRVASERIRTALRDTDTVGRLGGDEFGILVSQFSDPAELEVLLERIVAALRTVIPLGSTDVRISSSIGVALFPEDGQTSHELLQTADAAMYSVKSRGGDGFAFFDESMNAEAAARRRMRVELSDAIERGDFELHYQPVLSADGATLWGLEAQVRWRRGSEVVRAAEFIPFCTDSGLIRPLGRLILQLLSDDLQHLRPHVTELMRIAVNVSVPQLEDPELMRSMAGWPTPRGLAGLVVEVGESVLLPDNHGAMESLKAISRHAGQIAIDDFGAGYSNLRLLESLSPDYLKVDTHVVAEGRSLDAQLALMRSAVEIARVTGSAVIAEGVETLEQWQQAQGAGVDFVQGHHFAPPMALPLLVEWLAQRADHSTAPPP